MHASFHLIPMGDFRFSRLVRFAKGTRVTLFSAILYFDWLRGPRSDDFDCFFLLLPLVTTGKGFFAHLAGVPRHGGMTEVREHLAFKEERNPSGCHVID